jgi:hypothetical protein
MEHNFEDALKKLQKRWELCIFAEGDYFEDDGASFRPDGSTILGNYG